MAPLVPPRFAGPGVYVQEVPPGEHSIVGVPTSVAAFVGRTLRGPVDRPMRIHGFVDFQHLYGGLDPTAPMTYAVHDFFQNGGTQAWICRVWAAGEGERRVARPGAGIATFGAPPPADARPAPGTPVGFQAANPGAWGNDLRLSITPATGEGPAGAPARPVPPDLAALGLGPADLFDLAIEEVPPAPGAARREVFRSCAVHPAAGRHRVDRVLRAQSLLARVVGDPDDDTFTALRAGMPAQVAARPAAGGSDCPALSAGDYLDDPRAGLALLDQVDSFQLLVVPPDRFGQDTDPTVLSASLALCTDRRAFLIIDAPLRWQAQLQARGTLPPDLDADRDRLDLHTHLSGRFGAIYLPYIRRPDPLEPSTVRSFPPSGIIAGVFARHDEQLRVARAPAGLQATLLGVQALDLDVDDEVNTQLAQRGINVLRSLPDYGHVIWGARTLRGADELEDECKYIPARRLASYLEESLRLGLQWVAFEPDDERTWAAARRAIGAFLEGLYRQGCFAGATAQEAYFVRVDATTTTAHDIERGVMNVVVGFAPLRPGEFLVLYLEQRTAQASG
ncbi:phage tail sheath family protein [Myxococcota bacterium]|nr:phage tail sheath family protein [Myxococcota bacterium]